MAVEKLNDDLLVEILSRVPAKSLCRFKCISKNWLDLIHQTDHRKKLPQTLAGFVYRATDGDESVTKSSFRFIALSGSCRDSINTSFAYLPDHRRVHPLDCCNGLLLFCHYTARGLTSGYIVCNPGTEEWVRLPEPELGNAGKVCIARLGFDPAVSYSFYVFVLLETTPLVSSLTKVDVYSSGTGRWTRKEKTWNESIGLLVSQYQPSIFLNGCMHFVAFGSKSAFCLVAVDAEGNTWTTIRTPAGLYGTGSFVQQSHGCLHYCSFQRDEDYAVDRLVVYVLKDYANKDYWMLKHSVRTSHMSGGRGTHHTCYQWMVIHPHRDLIFFTAELDTSTKLMSYNMDRRQVEVVSNLEYGYPPYLPYVPFYAVPLQSLSHS